MDVSHVCFTNIVIESLFHNRVMPFTISRDFDYGAREKECSHLLPI